MRFAGKSVRRRWNTGSNPVGATIAGGTEFTGEQTPVRRRAVETVALPAIVVYRLERQSVHQELSKHLAGLWDLTEKEPPHVGSSLGKMALDFRGIERSEASPDV